MSKKQPNYISYLLRIWQSNGDRTTWRASLQNPHTDERIGFASIDELCAFLRRQTDAEGGSEDSGESTQPDSR